MENFKEDLRVGKIKLLLRLFCNGLELVNHPVDLEDLSFFCDVVQIGTEEEPYSMCEEKVDFTRFAQDVTNMILLSLIQ